MQTIEKSNILKHKRLENIACLHKDDFQQQQQKNNIVLWTISNNNNINQCTVIVHSTRLFYLIAGRK